MLRNTYSEEFHADDICLDIELFLGYRKLRNSSSPRNSLTSGKKPKTIEIADAFEKKALFSPDGPLINRGTA